MSGIRERSGRFWAVVVVGTAATAALSLLFTYVGWAMLTVRGCACVREPCPCRDPGFDVLRYLTAALCFGTLVMPWMYWRGVRTARRLTVVLAGYLVPMAAVAVTVTLMAID